MSVILNGKLSLSPNGSEWTGFWHFAKEKKSNLTFNYTVIEIIIHAVVN